jgi:large subunit ribosomal protein L23
MGIFSKISKYGKQNLAPAPKKDQDEKKADAPAAAEKKAVKPVTRGPLAKEGAGQSYRVLLSPLLTEKSERMQALGKYSFLVAADANKIEVARAVRDLYGVKPASVNIVNIGGKIVRFGRSVGKQKDVKKAIVTLNEGESITAFEGV